jgi:hypothetical protein
MHTSLRLVLLCDCHWRQRLQLASSGVVRSLLFKQLQGALVQRDIQRIQLPAGQHNRPGMAASTA